MDLKRTRIGDGIMEIYDIPETVTSAQLAAIEAKFGADCCLYFEQNKFRVEDANEELLDKAVTIEELLA